MQKFGQRILSLALTLLLSLTVQSAEQPKTFRFSCASMPHQLDYQFVFAQYKAAFAELGFEFEMQHVPKDEITSSMFERKFDGDCGRIPAFTQLFNIHDTLLIDPPVRTAQFNTWKLQRDQKPRRNSELRVQTIPQISSIDPYLEQMGFQVRSDRDSFDNLVENMRAEKIDRIVAYKAVIDAKKIRNEYTDIVQDKNIIILPVRGLIHKRHKSIIEPLSRALNAIKTRKANIKVDTKEVRKLATVERKDTITFSCTIPHEHDSSTLVRNLYRQAFEKLGYQYIQRDVSIREENSLLKRDLTDGSCGRSKLQSHGAPFDVIDVRAARVTMMLWSNQPRPDIAELSHIPTDHTLIVAGKTNRLDEILSPLSNIITTVEDPTQAFRFVISKRADYFLSFDYTPTSHLHRIEIKRPIFWAGNVDYGYVYPLLSKRHRSIATELTHTLRAFKASHPTLLDRWIKESR